MLELITPSGNVSVPDAENDYAVTHKYSGVDTLHFEIDLNSPAFPLLALEGIIRETTEDQRYRIRGIDAGETRAGVDCEIDLSGWKRDMYLNYTNRGASLWNTLTPVCPAGWSLEFQRQFFREEEINLEGGTPLSIFLAAQEKFDCAMRFDTKAQVCRIYAPRQEPLGRAVLTEGAGLLGRPQYTGKSTGLVTRLYPIGANGVTIASANGGKAYVENYSFTDEIICGVYQDERFTIPAHLKAAAEKKLKKLAVPSISWELSLCDLYRADPEQWPDHRVGLYSLIQFPYGDRQISALCVEEEIHPHRPEHNKVCIGAVPASVLGSVRDVSESVNDPNSAYNARRTAAVKHATEKIVGSSGGHVITVLDENGRPEEICILSDTDNIETAQSLWRWNESGLGHSSTGYNGAYSTAITKDGAIVADRITTGTLNAEMINLEGKFSVFRGKTMGGYIGFMAGATDEGPTDGIGVSDASGQCYAIATNEGIRMQSGNTRLYLLKDGSVVINGKRLVFSSGGAVRWEEVS